MNESKHLIINSSKLVVASGIAIIATVPQLGVSCPASLLVWDEKFGAAVTGVVGDGEAKNQERKVLFFWLSLDQQDDQCPVFTLVLLFFPHASSHSSEKAQ